MNNMADSGKKDPIRFLMNRKLSSMERCILGVVISMAFGLYLFLGAGWKSAPQVAVAGALCTGMMLFMFWRKMDDSALMVLLCSAAVVIIALLAHLSLMDTRSGRFSKTLLPMLEDMWNYDLMTAMSWEENSWSGGYLIILGFISRLENFSQLYAVKLVNLVCICLGAGAVYYIAVLNGLEMVPAGIAGGCALLAPTVLLNSGCWVQCDAVFAALSMWGLYLLLSGHPLSGCFLWGLAAGFKLQAAFLFPLLIPMFMERKISLRHLLALAAGFLLLHVPMILDGQEFISILGRYNEQIDVVAYEGAGLTDNSPGVYGLMNIASVREFSGMGLFLSLFLALLVALAMVRRAPLTMEGWLLCALLLSFGLPMILPQMNVRMFYLAFLVALTQVKSAKRIACAAAIEFISVLGYFTAIFGAENLPLLVLSLLSLGLCFVILLDLLDVWSHKSAVQIENGTSV